MHGMARLTSLVLAGSVLGSLPLLVGCNAIFGINEGKLGDGGAAGQSSQGGNAQGGQASQGGGGQGAGNTSGGGGEGGGTPFNPCDPTTFTDGDQSQTVGPDCGLFVDYNASGAGPGSGTKNDPFKTLEPAMAAHGAGVPIFIAGQPVIAASFIEARSGAIYGGLTTNWSRDLTLRPTIAATAMTTLKVPFILNFSPSDNYLFESLVLVGADASAEEDGISAALLINKGNVRIQNSLLKALRGGPGHGGMNGDSGIGANPGQTAASGCSTIIAQGGQLNCADGSNTNGGDGSLCSSSMGSSGQPGNGPLGGGPGGNGSCTPGGTGPTGMPGDIGVVGPLIGNIEGGTFDLGGAPPAPGGVAGGGGGGGGAKAGSSGGAGGSGGCGGGGGGGGGNGGASVPIIAFNANIDIVASKLQADGAGHGGNGGGGGPGTTGATGGLASGPNSCAGGKGGNGGDGGNGAGGNGGVGALVVSVGGMLTVDGTTSGASTPPAQANGGMGAGIGPNKAPDGLKGLRCAHLHFLGDGNGTHDCLTAF